MKEKPSNLVLLRDIESTEDHELYLERLDSIINYIVAYEDDEDAMGFLITKTLESLLTAKFFYLAWLDDEY